MNKYQRYRERRNARIISSLQERLGPDVKLPQSHREFTYLNRFKDLNEQAQTWTGLISNSSTKKGSTEPVTPQHDRPPQELSEVDPHELPRKLKLATALHVLENLGSAYQITRKEGDEIQHVMLLKILRRCRDLEHAELQDAINELLWDMKDKGYGN